MTLALIVAAAVLATLGLIALTMRRENRHDDQRARDEDAARDEETLRVFQQMERPFPPPRWHEPPTLGDAAWQHQLPASPAIHSSAPPACPGTGAEPGTAAAAAALPATPPAAAPPPLPDPAYAAAAGLPHHFAEWLSDTFVGRVEAIRDHGDCDFPLPVPAEWHAELRTEGLEA